MSFRAGGLKGTMQQCLAELRDSDLPADFKLRQTRSLLRYLREVSSLVEHIKNESGWECDTTSYLEILSTKEDSNLLRRVSDTRILKQDFDDKRREWRKQKKNLINAISEMKARAFKFECTERKTIALYSLAYYKNLMTTAHGAIPGESESTDGLMDQYRRHRDEISKIPMYADSIVKMLKDIRKTVRAYAKIQPGSNAFTQFLDEWWTSVVSFLQYSSIVNAEKNAREVMQTLKRLKGKQEANKKREMSRLLLKLDAQGDPPPPIITLSEEELEPQPELELSQEISNPEETVRSNGRRDGGRLTHQDSHLGEDVWEDRDISIEEDGDDKAVEKLGRADDQDKRIEMSGLPENASQVSSEFLSDLEGDQGGLEDLTRSGMNKLVVDVGDISDESWDAASELTAGTDTGTERDAPASSGLPREEDNSDDDEEDDLFEAANSLDLGAVALCATHPGTDGRTTYQDVSRTPHAIHYVTEQLGVEQQRYSAALEFFRHEQQQFRGKMAAPLPPPSPSFARLKSGNRVGERKAGVKAGAQRMASAGAANAGKTTTGLGGVRRQSSDASNWSHCPVVHQSISRSGPAKRGTYVESPRPQSLYLPRSASQRGGPIPRHFKDSCASPRMSPRVSPRAPIPRDGRPMTTLTEK
ncbi:unnamed protein product [Discosporangium mesarthrocarpum]